MAIDFDPVKIVEQRLSEDIDDEERERLVRFRERLIALQGSPLTVFQISVDTPS